MLEIPFQCKMLHTWVYTNASASGGKPPDPLWYNIFLNICWRPRRNKCPPFNMYGFTQLLQHQGTSLWPPLLFYIFTSEELDLMPLKGKRPQIYFFEHWQKCFNNAWFIVFRLGKLFELKIGGWGKISSWWELYTPLLFHQSMQCIFFFSKTTTNTSICVWTHVKNQPVKSELSEYSESRMSSFLFAFWLNQF